MAYLNEVIGQNFTHFCERPENKNMVKYSKKNGKSNAGYKKILRMKADYIKGSTSRVAQPIKAKWSYVADERFEDEYSLQISTPLTSCPWAITQNNDQGREAFLSWTLKDFYPSVAAYPLNMSGYRFEWIEVYVHVLHQAGNSVTPGTTFSEDSVEVYSAATQRRVNINGQSTPMKWSDLRREDNLTTTIMGGTTKKLIAKFVPTADPDTDEMPDPKKYHPTSNPALLHYGLFTNAYRHSGAFAIGYQARAKILWRGRK